MDFFIGVRRTQLAPDEMLVEIIIPAPAPDWRFYLGLWFTVGLLIDVGLGASAWIRRLFRYRVKRYSP